MIRTVKMTCVSSASTRPSPLGDIAGAAPLQISFRRSSKNRRASVETNTFLQRFIFTSESFIDPIEISSD
ncbi:hypothetical protein Bca52824_033653 [Brassica carinata]|uniref:Uncharacterized protein n=1 Tax=Brassica carinata TaxID=52824 RepID=A0A8X7SER7_BRACI|nr:hypothetical protein Bca52824_033653 [Brassica carinata]